MKGITVYTTYEEANSQLQEYLDENKRMVTKLCSAGHSLKMGELKSLVHLFAYGSSVYGFRSGIKTIAEYCSDPCDDLGVLVEGIQGKVEEQSILFAWLPIVPLFYIVEEELRGNSIPEEKKEELRSYLRNAPELQQVSPQILDQHVDFHLEFLFKEDKMRGLSKEERDAFVCHYFKRRN